MSQSVRRLTALGALVVLSAITAVADITRTSGPTTVVTWPVVLFDAAFDTTNQVYLIVWGPHSQGPARGQFLNASGAPIGSPFAVSAGAEWSGWARVSYSAEYQTFLVAYTKILGSNSHQRTARLITYSGGSPSLSGEIFIDTFAGAPGVDAGDVDYSVASDVFIVTWRESEPGQLPQSYAAAVTPAGAVGTRHLVSNPADGQSDPRIACNDSGRCLVLGWAWGNLAGGTTSMWGRFVDGADATPVGSTSFYVDTYAAITAGEVGVTYNPLTGEFFTVSTRDGSSIWGKTVTPAGGLGTATLLKQSVNPAVDGGGYGFPNITYNPASQTLLLTMGNYYGTACAQELSAFGAPIGATDCVPFPAQDNTGFNVGVADPVNTRYLMLDNHNYASIRASIYQAQPSSGGPIAPSIVTHPQTQTIASGSSTTLSVVATGTAPLSYQWYSGVAPDTSTPVGTNASSYTTPTLSGVFNYWVRVSNGGGSANSNTATVSATGSGGGSGGMSRLSGPTTVINWPVVLFDAAFDTANQIYLVVWGPHSPGPAQGQFLNKNGAPIGSPFPVSAGAEWTGWARVAYSPVSQSFLVAYTKILGSNSHQRTARLVAFNGGTPSMSGEIFIDTFQGAPGVDAGDVEYSPANNVFLVSWRESEPGLLPESFVASVTPGGAVGTRHRVSNPADGQSDPRIACSGTGRCLVAGWAWGNLAGGTTSLWGRFVDGADATPAGSSSFYIDSYPAITAGEVSVAYNPDTGNFFTASTRDGNSIWGKVVSPSGGLGTAFLLKQSVNSSVDGGGYGHPNLAYNAASQTMILTMGNYYGTACAQELSVAGAPIGSTDCVPFSSTDNTGFNAAVADPVNARFLMLDNFNYAAIRATVYQTTPVSQAPVITTHPLSQTIAQGQTAVLTVAASGSAPLSYQWYQGVAPDTSTPIGGATNSSYTTPNLFVTTPYWVRVTNTHGSADSTTATIRANYVSNGNFAAGTGAWQSFGSPTADDVQWNVTNGVLQFWRQPPPSGGVNQATIFQNTGFSFAAGTPLEARFDLGNTSSVRRRITVLLVESDFSDLQACTFWLEPGAPLTTYRMESRNIQAWTNASIYFYASTPGWDNGYYQVDNVSLSPNGAVSTTRTNCVDPLAPAAPGGPAGPNLVSNPIFFGNAFSPWTTFGSIVTQVVSGVLEFYRPAGPAAGVVFQNTGAAMPEDAIVTAWFKLGNSSGVRKRVTVLLHDASFNDLQMCTFWLAPGQALSNYAMRTSALKAWSQTTISFYVATIGNEAWIRADDIVMMTTPASPTSGTDCLEPGSAPPHPGPESSTAGGSSVSADAGAASPLPGGGVPAVEPDAIAPLLAAAAEHTGLQQFEPWTSIDLREATSATLALESRLADAAGSAARVDVSADGATWEPLVDLPASDGWLPLDADLSPWAGRVIRVRFVFEAVAPPAGLPPDQWQLRNVRVRR